VFKARISGQYPRELTVRMTGDNRKQKLTNGGAPHKGPCQAKHTTLRRKQLDDGDMGMKVDRHPGWKDIVNCSPAYKSPGLVYQYGVMTPAFMRASKHVAGDPLRTEVVAVCVNGPAPYQEASWEKQP
jgi:hypothetical protein